MSLDQRQEMRRCGHRFGSELDARCSKRGQQPGAVIEECWVPGCGGWHVRSEKAATGKPAPKGSGSGPSDKVRALVIARDLARCVCCGRSVAGQQASIQHRRARGMGGSSEAHASCCCNLVLALGSGTTGCHGRMESRRDPHDRAKGYVLEQWEVPALAPVMVFDRPGGSGVSQFATCDGQWSSAPGQVSA
jgi:hypothetical protein